jgi:hypothetical protein
MAKLSVIADKNGKLLGAVRSGPAKTKDGRTLQFRPHPEHKHVEMEVDDRLLRGPAAELGRFIREKLK